MRNSSCKVTRSHTTVEQGSTLRASVIKPGKIFVWKDQRRHGRVARVEFVRDLLDCGEVVFFMRKGDGGYECFDAMPLDEFLDCVTDPTPGPSIYARAMEWLQERGSCGTGCRRTRKRSERLSTGPSL